ncbi:MAG: PadR family transcriptional regulator [Actinophytocola sp.]
MAPRMTLPTQRVLRELMADPTRPMYGLELCAAAGLPSGTIHPILARLERFGWLESHWEEVDPHEKGRPRRRYYRLDPNSVAAVRSALERAEAGAAALRSMRPGLAGGA